MEKKERKEVYGEGKEEAERNRKKKKSLEKRKERERVHTPEIRDGFRIVGSATGRDGCI